MTEAEVDAIVEAIYAVDTPSDLEKLAHRLAADRRNYEWTDEDYQEIAKHYRNARECLTSTL